jgi:hypothetical protein
MERGANLLNISPRGLFFLLLFCLIAAGAAVTFFVRYLANRAYRHDPLNFSNGYHNSAPKKVNLFCH